MRHTLAGFLVAASLWIGGCAPADRRAALLEERNITLERVRTPGVTVASASLAVADGGVVVRGTVQRDRFDGGFPRGHVHVHVLGHDRRALADARDDYLPRGRFSPRRLPTAAFRVLLPSVPPHGSTVRVTRHAPGDCDPA